MITKVNTIKNFGIFNSFHWNNSINSFSQKNLIYGWNYSGKTTFSKLFHNFEDKKKTNFPLAEYTIEIKKDTENYTQETLSNFPHIVKVFNADYVKDVFSFDNKAIDGFNPISFYLGDEAGDIQPQIDKLNIINSRYENLKKTKYQPIVNTYNDYAKENGKFSSQASEIRRYLNNRVSSNEFNKKQLNEIVSQIKSGIEANLLGADKVEETRQQSIEENTWKILNENFSFVEELENLIKKTNGVLNEKAIASIPFPELDSNQVSFNWVQTGLDIHGAETNCKFCGNLFSKERQEILNKYYSDKLKEIQSEIEILRKEIEIEKTKIEIQFQHESLIATHLQLKYKDVIINYNLKKGLYISILGILETDLLRKESSFFESLNSTVISNESIQTELNAIITVIKEHNDFIKSFDIKKVDSLKQILNHYVAEYLISENYIDKEAHEKIASQKVSTCINRVIANNLKIIELESKLKDTVKGQEELNVNLEIFLNRNDIKIEIENSKFILKRGTFHATNLSEGEKTAIAFAYFLTELKSLKKENKLSNTIIFLDDPISSLDSNHIFQIRSLISHFFQKNEDYLQLFISTHNFEFFSIMLDCNIFKNVNRQDTKEVNCPFYLIHRTNTDASTIKNLPKSLRSHKSEYAHLFHILNEYNALQDKEDFEFNILLPNALRRFLELYSLFKYPKGFSEIDERIKKIFDLDEIAYHQTKLYHWFSHQNQFEKISQHDGKLILIDEAIIEVINHLKTKDKLHWLGLTGETL